MRTHAAGAMRHMWISSSHTPTQLVRVRVRVRLKVRVRDRVRVRLSNLRFRRRDRAPRSLRTARGFALRRLGSDLAE